MVGEVAVAIGVHGPIERLDHQVGRPVATEDLDGIERGLRRHTRPDPHRRKGSRGIPGAAVGRAIGRHAVAPGGACHVSAVPPAVQRIVVGLRDGERGIARVVGVAREVVASCDLGRIGVDRGLARALGGECILIRGDGAGAAEVGVRVVDAGIHDPDRHSLARARRTRPCCGSTDQRDGDEVVTLLGHESVHGLDSGDARESIQVTRIRAHRDAGVDVCGLEDDVALADGAAYPCGECLDARDRGAGRRLLGPRRGCRSPGEGCWLGVELEHDAHRLWRCGQRKALHRSRALR